MRRDQISGIWRTPLDTTGMGPSLKGDPLRSDGTPTEPAQQRLGGQQKDGRGERI
jgi:hypothetical protein